MAHTIRIKNLNLELTNFFTASSLPKRIPIIRAGARNKHLIAITVFSKLILAKTITENKAPKPKNIFNVATTFPLLLF